MTIAIYRDISGNPVKVVAYRYFPPRKPRTKHDKQRSEYESRRRAFSLASLKLAQNPDMNVFLTLTYDPKKNPNPDYLNDLKNLFRGTGAKYIATFERHKHNPCLHIHLITNYNFPTYINENGFPSIKKWHKGFSSVKYLSDTDQNFRVAKYIFKYITKSEKIKHKFVYSSRGLLLDPEVHDFWWRDNDYFYNRYMFDYYFGGLQTYAYSVSSTYNITIGRSF